MTAQQQELINRVTNDDTFKQLGQANNNDRTMNANQQKSREELELIAKQMGEFSKTGIKFAAGLNINENQAGNNFLDASYGTGKDNEIIPGALRKRLSSARGSEQVDVRRALYGN